MHPICIKPICKSEAKLYLHVFSSNTLRISEMQQLPQVDQKILQAAVTRQDTANANYSVLREDGVFTDMVLLLCMTVYNSFYFYMLWKEEHTSSLYTLLPGICH